MKKQQSLAACPKRLARTYLNPHALRLILALCFMIWGAGMTGAFALMIEPIIDDVLGGGEHEKIWGLAAAIFLIFFTRGLAGYGDAVFMNTIGQSIVAQLQKDLFARLMLLDLKFFHNNPSGQLLSIVINDVNAMRTAVTSSLTGIGRNVLTLIVLLGVMFYQDWVLACAAFLIFPFAAGFVAWIGRRLRKMSGRIQDHLADLSARLSQIFQGIRLVKAYGMEAHEQEESAQAIDRVRDQTIKSVKIGNLSTPVNELLVGLVVFGIVVYGGYQVSAGQATAGELMSFIGAFIMSYEPMKKLAKLNNTLQMGLGAADRVFDIMDRQPRVINRKEAAPARFTRPEIAFGSVSFQYEDGETKALDNVSLTLPAGKVTALVGRSGSGKTTIMNLIPRFFDVTEGQVTIDGLDVRDMEIASLRQNIALVSQDITIFDDTVWANIGYGRQGAYRDEIIKAAIAAEADDFIRALPKAYDTRLGEDGLKLSGGQRQRIAIARAILRDAPVLLLDEATSALDNEAERAIQSTLSTLQQGRTTLVIAHRLSTVQNADQILVLEQGRVIERGRHDYLKSINGIYAKMYGAGLPE